MQKASSPIKLSPLEGDELINPRGFLNVLLGDDYFTTRPDEILGSVGMRSGGNKRREAAALGFAAEYIMKQTGRPLGLKGEALSVDEIRALRRQLRQEVAEVLENAREVVRCLTDVRHQWVNYPN